MDSQKKYEAIAASLAEDGAVASQMFGMPTLKIGGKAFAGLYEEGMVFKLTGEAHKKALAVKDAKLFEPMQGRPMKEWVQLPAAASTKWRDFADKALAYVLKSKKK